MSTQPTQTLKVLLPIFPNFNTLDLNGPIEVLANANRQSSSPTPHFSLSITSATPITTSVENVHIQRDISLVEALHRVKEWDIVVLAGGVEGSILEIMESGEDEGGLMRLLGELGREAKERVIMSVCTGALFLGGLGFLEGRRVTTHWRSLGTLKRILEEKGVVERGGTEVVRARWVDSPASGERPRIITAGGVSCGIDASFHLLDETVGPELAAKVAEAMDYQRRGDELQLDSLIPESN